MSYYDGKIKYKVGRVLIVGLLLFSVLQLSCTDASNSPPSPEYKEEIQTRIVSPQNGSSFSDDQNIRFQVNEAEADMQSIDVYLNDQKINIRHGEMLPKLLSGQHKLSLIMNGKKLNEVNFIVIESGKEAKSDFILSFKGSSTRYLREYREIYDFSGCLPTERIETKVFGDITDWKELLLKMFTVSQEWNSLVASWKKSDGTTYHGYMDDPPACTKILTVEQTDAWSPYNFFIDFGIMSQKTSVINLFQNLIKVNFKHVHTPSSYSGSNRLVTSSPEWKKLWSDIFGRASIRMPEKYESLDFSKHSIVTLSTKLYEEGAGGCGLTAFHESLVAIYELNKKLYIIKKAIEKYALFPFGYCRAIVPLKADSNTILILDYAKDLPVEFIEIP